MSDEAAPAADPGTEAAAPSATPRVATAAAPQADPEGGSQAEPDGAAPEVPDGAAPKEPDGAAPAEPVAISAEAEEPAGIWSRHGVHIAMVMAVLGMWTALAATVAPWWQLRSFDTLICPQFSAANPCTGPPAGAHIINSTTYFLDQTSGPEAFAVLAIAAAAVLLAALLVLMLTGHITWQGGAAIGGAATALLVLALASDPRPATAFLVFQSGPGWGRTVCVVSAVCAGVAAVAAGSIPDSNDASRARAEKQRA